MIWLQTVETGIFKTTCLETNDHFMSLHIFQQAQYIANHMQRVFQLNATNHMSYDPTRGNYDCQLQSDQK